MSEIYNTGLLKEQSKQQTKLRVDEKERQGFDRFLKGYMPESEDMTFRTVRDAKRNFEIIERCRSLQRDIPVTSTASGSAMQAVQPEELTYKEKREMENKTKEARSHIPNADLSVYNGAQALGEIKKERASLGLNDFNFKDQSEEVKKQVIDELLSIRLDESMLTEDYIMSHVGELSKYCQNLTAVRNYFLSEEGRGSFDEMDELEIGVINTRIISIAVPVQKHISNILLKNGLSLKNMTYVDLKNDANGSEGYLYKNTDLIQAATDSFSELLDVLATQKDAESELFEENIGATIHTANFSEADLQSMSQTNPAQYQLITEYLEAEEREKARRRALAASKTTKIQEDQPAPPKTIDQTIVAEEEETERKKTMDRRRSFIKTGNVSGVNSSDDADEHAEAWVLSDYEDVIWAEYEKQCDSKSEDFIKDDNKFYAKIMSLNSALAENLNYVNTLINSQEVREKFTLGSPELERKLRDYLKSNKKNMLTLDPDAFQGIAKNMLSEYKPDNEAELEKQTSRYNELKEILPESCFKIAKISEEISKLVLESNEEAYKKSFEAIVAKKEKFSALLREEVEKSVTPISSEKVYADLEKIMDYRMVFTDKRSFLAAVRGELKYLVFASPEGVYLDSDFKALMDSYGLPMDDSEYVKALSDELKKNKEWEKAEHGSKRVEAMKKLVDQKAKELVQAKEDKSKKAEASKTETAQESVTEPVVKEKPIKQEDKPDEDAAKIQRTRKLVMFTENVSQEAKEINYQYNRVKGKDRWFFQGKFELTERERRLRYARRVWELLEERGCAANCARFLPALYDKNKKDPEQKAARDNIKKAIKDALNDKAPDLPGYMGMGKITENDILSEIRLMGMDAELMSTGGAGEETFLKYESEEYKSGLKNLGDRFSARYIDFEETLSASYMHLSDQEKKDFRSRMKKAMCSENDDEWALTMAQFTDYVRSSKATTESKKALANEAEALHQRVSERTQRLMDFDGGKFAPVIERLKQDSEVWKKITEEKDDDAFDLYMEKLNDTVGVLMDAAKKSGIPEFVLQQYLADHYASDLGELENWDDELDKLKETEDSLSGLRAEKVSHYSEQMATYLDQSFMNYRIEGRESIETHIKTVWENTYGKKEGMDPLTYVSLLYSEKGASLKMLYKKGTLEKELEIIRNKQEEYKAEIESVYNETEVPAELSDMKKEDLRVMYDKYVFIHAKDLPEHKGKKEGDARKAEALKMVEAFYVRMKELHEKEVKQERKSEKTIREEREFARHVEAMKNLGGELSANYFNMGMTPEELDGLMKSRSVILAGTQAHLDNTTDELKDHDEELAKIVGKEGMDPFVHMCLLEKYQGIKHSDRKNDAKKTVEQELLDDHAYLSRLNTFSTNEGYSKEKQEFFISWFYRHGEPSTLFLGHETNTDADFLKNDRFLEKQKIFEQGYAAIQSIEGLKVQDPVVKREQTEYIARMRMEFFAMDPEAMASFESTLNRKKRYLFLEDVMSKMYKEALESNKEVNVGEGTDYGRYLTGLKEYFTAPLMQVILDDEKSTEDFDLEKFKTEYESKIKEIVDDSSKRQFLYNSTSTVTFDDVYGVQKAIEGQKTSKDLEQIIRSNEGSKDAYDKLTPQEKKLFALALTITSEGGSAIYEGTAALLKGEEEKQRIQDAVSEAATRYLDGEDIEGFIDYDVAVRKLLKDKTGTSGNDEYNKDVFAEAMSFTNLMMERRRQNIEEQKVDKKLLRDGTTSIYAANLVAAKPQINEIGKAQLRTIEGLTDALRKDAKTSESKKIMERIETLIKEDGLWMLIEVLQDRNALDFSTGQQNAEDAASKVIGHVDDMKRKAVKERFMDDSNVAAMRKRAERQGHLKGALMSLLSFQLRDDVDFSKREITEEDFAKDVLKRNTTFDWKLIGRGLDFLKEITGEQNRRKVLSRNYIKEVGTKKQNDCLESVEAYEGKKKEYDSTQFEAQLMAFVEGDLTKDSEGDEHAAIMAGYFALSDQEKALFFRALEHRDVLDISKVNLYWNLVGRGDRDFVNPEGRNALIDEFIRSTGKAAHMTMREDTIYNAMTSLLSTQMDDSLDFSDPKNDLKKYVAGERVYLFQRKTAIDWKLFARALQMVHRAKTEMDLTKGDRELQRAMGDIASTGRMSMDTSFMRTNIHCTGGRLTRFVATQIGDKVVDELPVDTLQGIAAKVLSTDSMNRINGVLSRLSIEAEEEEDEEEEEEEQQDEEEEEEDSFIKSVISLVSDVKGAVDDINEELEPIKESKEVEKTPLQKILAGAGIEESDEGLLDELIEGISSAFEKIGDLPDQKEEVDGIVKNQKVQAAAKKVLGQTITNFVMKYYNKGSDTFDSLNEMYEEGIENITKDVDALLAWIPHQEKIMELGEKFSTFWEDNGEDITGYVGDAVSCAVSMKAIYAASQNMKALDEATEKAVEDRKKDDERIAKEIRAQSEAQSQLFRDARAVNRGLTDLSATFSKDREKEDVIVNSGDIAGTVARVAADVLGANDAVGEAVENIVKEASKIISFIHHCIADHKGMEEYYGGAGSYQAEAVRKNTSRLSGYSGRVESMSNAKLVQTARGFESEEELVKFTGFQMVHSLLFSASDYNPLDETKNVSKVVLAVLGLEDLIGKTDSESAMRVFAGLTR